MRLVGSSAATARRYQRLERASLPDSAHLSITRDQIKDYIIANIDNPTEEQEQMAFVQWLRLKGYAHFRVPNETYTKSFKQKAKNKALGVSSGVPDLFVSIPNTGAIKVYLAEIDRHGYADYLPPKNRLVAIEMKRKKGGTTSTNQKKWLKILNDGGIQAVVCKGCDEAIKFIESITK